MNRQQRKTKRKASRSAGLAFEKKVCRAIQNATQKGFLSGEAYCGQWIEYQDVNGLGYAQPDVFLLREDEILLLEIKLTQTMNGWSQMEDLYEPLLHYIYGLPIRKALVCQNLRWNPDILVDDADELCPEATWHFL